jgi:hypothetical protein
LTAARNAGQLRLSDPARTLWHHAYHHLAEPRAGLAGQLGARAEAHTIRLALIYALRRSRSPSNRRSGQNEALRTGTYGKTLTFTLSTTNP